MRYAQFLQALEQRPLYDRTHFRVDDRQLQRWVRSGRLLRLRRGLYLVSERQATAVEIANSLVPQSYVSGLSALALHGYVAPPQGVISVTRQRPRRFDTPLGQFSFHRLADPGLIGSVVEGVASPERALLDHFRLTPGLVTLPLAGADRLDYDHLLANFRGLPQRLRRLVGRTLNRCRRDRFRARKKLF
ncbi:MAG: hypothetical protein AB7S38_32115 [Vulcanimicrobiota bacterium]